MISSNDEGINEGNKRYEIDDLIYLSNEDCYIIITNVTTYDSRLGFYDVYLFDPVKGSSLLFDVDEWNFFEYKSGVWDESEFICQVNDKNITKVIGEIL